MIFRLAGASLTLETAAAGWDGDRDFAGWAMCRDDRASAVPGAVIRVVPALDAPADAVRVLRSPAGWEAFEAAGRLAFHVGSGRARVEGARAWVTAEGAGFPLAHPLGEMVVGALLAGRALELHAAGVARDGDCWALAGVSGVGKSTISALWARRPGWSRMAEERLLLWPAPEGWMAQAAPWPPGVERAPGTARLRGILLLAQAPGMARRPVSPALAAALLLRCTFYLSGSAASTATAAGMAARLAAEVPVARLALANTAEAVAAAAGAL